MNKARVKFLLHKVGIEEFRARWTKSSAQPWAWEPIDMAALMQLAPEGPTPGEAPNGVAARRRTSTAGCRRTSSQADASPASSPSTITVPLGNLSPGAVPRARRASCGKFSRRQRPHAAEPEPRPALGARRVAPRAPLRAEGDRPRRLRRRPARRHRRLPGHRLLQDGHHLLAGRRPRDHARPSRSGASTTRSCSRSTSSPAAARTAAASTTSPRSASRARPSSANGATIPCFDIFLGGGGYVGGGKYGVRVARVPSKRAPAGDHARSSSTTQDEPERGRGVRRLRRPRRPEELRPAAGRVQGSRPRAPGHPHVHGLGQGRAVPGHPRRRRVRGLDARPLSATSQGAST